MPIIHNKNREEVFKYAETVEKILKEEKISVNLDRRNLTPGEKFYYWEKRGIQIRIEIGPKEKNEDVITIVTRHNLQRKMIARKDLVKMIKQLLDGVDQDLLRKAESQIKNRIGFATSYDEVLDLIKEKFIINVPSCGKENCNLRIEEKTGLENIGFSIEKSMKTMGCLSCNEETNEYSYLAKSF